MSTEDNNKVAKDYLRALRALVAAKQVFSMARERWFAGLKAGDSVQYKGRRVIVDGWVEAQETTGRGTADVRVPRLKDGFTLITLTSSYERDSVEPWSVEDDLAAQREALMDLLKQETRPEVLFAVAGAINPLSTPDPAPR